MTIMRVTTEWSGTGQGQPYFSTHHFEGDTNAEAQAAVTALATFWGTIDNIQNSTVVWTINEDVELVDEVTGTITAVTQVASSSGAGAAVTAVLPWATQALVRWRTGIFSDGREIRGRTFVPGMTTTQMNAGSLTIAAQTTLDNAADALIADVNSTLVIWQRPRAADPARDIDFRPGSFAAVVSSSVWIEFATLRSRRD